MIETTNIYGIFLNKLLCRRCLCYFAPEGGFEVLFSPCLSVCVCLCQANILVFYFSAIRRDIDVTFIQDTYGVVLNSLENN